MTEAFTHRGVGEVYVAQGVGIFDPGDLLVYDPDSRGLRTYHPNGTWAEYTVTPDGTCRVVLAEQPKAEPVRPAKASSPHPSAQPKDQR